MIADLSLELLQTQEELKATQEDVANLTLTIMEGLLMRNIGIRYYKMGFYTNEQFALFVKRGFVTPEEYKEMTGVDYDPEKHMYKPAY